MSVDEMILKGLLVQPINSIVGNVSKSSLKHNIAMTKDGPYIHIDRGGSVLAVCHLDYVKFSNHPTITNNIVKAGQLDDRLGLYIITHHLQQYTDIPYDILLTDSEEVGKSTAKDFIPNKEYNWMFSFDREGTDVVLYKYEGVELKHRLENFGFDIGVGSFSDISYLGHLNIKGMNIGTAYYKSHTKDSWADLREMDTNVQKFSNFLERFHNTKMYHDESMDYQLPYYNYGSIYSDSQSLKMDDYSYSIKECQTCYEDIVLDIQMRYCPYCGDRLEFSED